ncbi:MAG: sugar transferase, partial [Actinobacteria bacterium]|nr:sugar transferase [Actinomycetota bacterium]
MVLDLTDKPRVRARPRGWRRQLSRRAAWQGAYVKRLVAVDLLAVLVAGAVAHIFRFGLETTWVTPHSASAPYAVLTWLSAPVWLAVLAMSGAYARTVVGVGSEEYRRVFNAGLRYFAIVGIGLFIARVDLARGFVGGLVPSVTVLSLLGRYAVRRHLHRKRGQGGSMHCVLVVGTIGAVTDVVRHFQRAPYAGFSVVGSCIPSDVKALHVGDSEVPVFGTPDVVLDALVMSQANVVAVAGDSALPPGGLRALAWQLEGTGIDLIVAPAVTDVAGPRIAIRPIAGLPLLHLEEPQLSGGARLFKELFDRTTAAVALLLLAPVMAAIALAVRSTTTGPALYRQERVGRDGQCFTIWKFRTMVVSAEEELHQLITQNDQDGLLFKIRDDPRVTNVGRWLRRHSLDELPQLWNVVSGHMSLVGPRPPLASEVERYGDELWRRLLVKPGLTGLWQVSGRSDLPWDEA